MKIVNVLVLIMVALCGCSAQSAYEGQEPEDVGVVQEALGFCTQPTGSWGSQVLPISEYVTGMHVGAHTYEINVETTDISTGTKTTGTVTFGVGQAFINGAGWEGTRLTQLVVGAGGLAGKTCPTNYTCILFRGSGGADGMLQFNNFYGFPYSGDWSTTNMGDGVVKVRGYGLVQAQTLRFYNANTGGGSLFSRQWRFEGPALDACTDPG